jgi:hypothetical protein
LAAPLTGLSFIIKKEVMKKIKNIFKIKKETASATPKMEKAMLPKLEKRNK